MGPNTLDQVLFNDTDEPKSVRQDLFQQTNLEKNHKKKNM